MKKSFVFLLLTVLVFLSAGCGKAEKKENRKEYYYVPEHRELTFGVNYISSMTSDDDMLYMIGSTWDEETYEVTTKFMTYRMADGSYTEMQMEVSENQNIQQMFMTADNRLLALIGSYEINDTTGEYKESYTLAELSAQDGKVVSETDVTEAFKNIENFYLQYCVADGAGNLYLSDGNQCVLVLDGEGKLLANIALGDWIETLFVDKEDKVYVKQWGANGQEIRPLDITAKTLGEPIKAENLVRGDRYNQTYIKGTESSLIVNDSSGVYTYDFATDTAVDVFDWLDADINSDSIEKFGVLPDGRYWVLMRDWTENKEEYSLALLTKTPASEVPEKEELVYATMYLSQEVRQSIIDFNKSSEQYHITVKEYQGEDAETAMIQFHTDLTSGNCPDIINMTGLNLDRYVAKGVLEDLYPYMEKEGIAQEEYLTNILKAYETDGKLYALIPQFSIDSSVIKKAHVKEAKGWTLDEMLATVENSGAEEVFSYADRYSVFYHCVYMNMDEYVDWATGECYFDSEAFIKVMEFAKQFPEQFDYEKERDGLSERIRDGRILMLENGISSVQEYQMLKGMFGEDITFIGYPNSQRNGTLIRATVGEFAIASQSKNKDAAWAFLKTFLSEEYQDGMISGHGWGFPIKKSSLEKQFEKDMTPEYYKDENGNKIEDPKTSWGYDDFQIDIYAATEEEIGAVREILESAELRTGSVDEELQKIITEETEAFFKGQKSAKETADIIQNRAKIYVSENS